MPLTLSVAERKQVLKRPAAARGGADHAPRQPRGSSPLMRYLIAAAALLCLSRAALAQEESRADAWWTGPMLAANAASLPQGHALIEPYLFDVISNASFDANGERHGTPTQQTVGSLSYILYGLTDRIGVGLLPRLQYNIPAGASNSGGIGDLTLQASCGLLHFQEGRRIPDVSLVIQEALPTGRYEHLTQPSDGIGAGAYTTSFALYTQDYFWLPNGRILRARLDVTYSVSSRADVQGVSVYGTGEGFSGHAQPGNGFMVDAAAEYSLTRHWVLALDVVYQHSDTTQVDGNVASTLPPPSGVPPLTPYHSTSGASDSLGFAPALEYNFTSAVGVLLGVRVIEIGRNTAASITPALALNMVF